jgi:lambda family phage tail tape measure protein
MSEQKNLAKGAGEAVQEYMNKLSPEQFAAKMEAFDKLARENPADTQRIGFLKAAASIDYYSTSLDKAAGQIRALNKSNQEWDNESAISEAAMTHALDNKIKAQHKARIEQETYNDALAAGNITLAEYTNLMAESQINALEKATDAQSGYTRGFLKVGQGIRDMASASEKVVTDAFGNMEDAVVGFVKTGKLDFSGLVDSMLEDMTRLLMKQAMNGLFGSFGSGGGGVSGLVGGIGSMLGFAGGGDPPVGQPSIVGERGPEIFVPKTAGTVMPNTSMSPQQIKVVNVQNPKDAVSAMNSADGERVILNVLHRNRTAMQRELS